MGGTREPPLRSRRVLRVHRGRLQGVGADEDRVRLNEGAGDGLHAAVEGNVSEAGGLGASRIHDDRWEEKGPDERGRPTPGSESRVGRESRGAWMA